MGAMMRHGAARHRGFILLEVMVAIVIIAVAMVALMRGFIVSLDSVNKIRMNEEAIYLAQSFLDDLILEPPAEGDSEGSFGDDIRYGEKYQGWHWKLNVESDDPDYTERPMGKLTQDLEQVYVARLEIYYEDQWGPGRRDRDERTYINVQTILMEPDIFSTNAIQGNQLF